MTFQAACYVEDFYTWHQSLSRRKRAAVCVRPVCGGPMMVGAWGGLPRRHIVPKATPVA
jgi:hypothetical protein